MVGRAVRAAIVAGAVLAAGLVLADPVVRVATTPAPAASGAEERSDLARVAFSAAAPARATLLDGYGRPISGSGSAGGGSGRSTSALPGTDPGDGSLDGLSPFGIGRPQIVTSDDPPSVRLVPPRRRGADRGIADTGKHSPGDLYDCTCPQKYQPSTRVPLRAAARGNPIAVSWWHNGDPAAVRYRVGYQPQTWVRAADGDLTLPAFTWRTVAPGTGAGTRTTSFRATPGPAYTVVLVVELTTPETGRDGIRMEVGRLDGVRAG